MIEVCFFYTGQYSACRVWLSGGHTPGELPDHPMLTHFMYRLIQVFEVGKADGSDKTQLLVAGW